MRAAAAVAKRKLGSTPTILTERHLPGDQGVPCVTGPVHPITPFKIAICSSNQRTAISIAVPFSSHSSTLQASSGSRLSKHCRCAAENRGGTCNTGGTLLTGTRSKSAPKQQDTFTLPSCQKQLEAAQKKAKLLSAHAEICKLDLPRRKASMHMTVQSRGATNSLRMPKRIVKGRTNGR